jgi:uncharacterized membrane protein (DUF2068 family)
MPDPQPKSSPRTLIQRFTPTFHYELLVCGLRGHSLLGADASKIRDEDAAFVRVYDGLRWYRCLRCDSWIPLAPPAAPAREFPPAESEVELPIRGRALRDKIVLRLIAIDRAIHFVLLAGLAVLIFVFAAHRAQLQRFVNRLETAFYGDSATNHHHAHGLLHELERIVSVNGSTLWLIGVGAALYAVLEGTEAVGLWFQYRWAEYLTVVATALFVPLEIYELSKSISILKIVALVVNLAIIAYLLYAKRLFGIRGGAAADRAIREQDSGWEAFHRLTPGRPPVSGAG